MQLSNNKIVIIGSSNTDLVIKTDRLPKAGETVLGEDFKIFSGGKGANQAVAAARLGGNVIFVSKIGNDTFGKQALEKLQNENIDTRYVFFDSQLPSGIALISVDKKGENSIVVAPGANAALSASDIQNIRSVIESADILLMQLEIPMETVVCAAKIAHDKGVKVILNPAPMESLSDELLRCLYAIIPNKTEAEKLSGIQISNSSSVKHAADIISSKGIENVIITLGRDGAFIKNGNNYCNVQGHKVKAVDTTAAGDTFCGAFCVGISEGLSICDAVKIGNKAASIAVMREGAQASIPYRSEIDINLLNN